MKSRRHKFAEETSASISHVSRFSKKTETENYSLTLVSVEDECMFHSKKHDLLYFKK